jgi:anaerobic ribonucleoside-triphosphate reductase
MSDYCHVSAQVAINADEPECDECEHCGIQMDEDEVHSHLTCIKCHDEIEYEKISLGEKEDE